MKKLGSFVRSQYFCLTALFASFMFAQFAVLRMGNQAGSGFLSGQHRELVYLFIQAAAILGFLSHAPAHSRLGAGRSYKLLTAAVFGSSFVFSTLMLVCSPATLFYLIITGAAVVTLGFAGGSVYVTISAMFAANRRPGLCLGLGYAAAVAAQYFLQLRWNVIPALAVLLTASFGAAAFFVLRGSVQAHGGEKKPGGRSAVIFAAVITLALLLFTSYYNRYIHHLQIASGYTDYNVYSWPRLFMIPTVIAFGFVGDIKKGRFLPLATVCVSALALLNTSLMGRETYLLNMSLYYVALTAVIAYYHLTFLRLAPDTKHPALWAVMGRVLDSAAVMLSFAFRFYQLSQATVLFIDIACLAVVVVMMSLSGGFNLAPGDEKQKSAHGDPFPLIQEEFGITPSELRVLRELVLTDDKQDVIAKRLSISVSTLRHHVTSIYKKTGTQTRSALCKLTASKEKS